jgi:hypothetical protein
MDGSRIAALTSRGYAISCAHVGVPFQLYRSTTSSAPISPTNLLAALSVAISTDSYRFKNPVAYSKPLRRILVDKSQTTAGDYLVSASQTLFIADQSPLVPVQAVVCNSVISVHRPIASTSVGAITAYGGDEAELESVLASSFPCSVLQGTTGERGDVNLPGDTRVPWWTVLMPANPSVAIDTDDILIDAAGVRYIVSSAELSQLGWRLTAMQESA